MGVKEAIAGKLAGYTFLAAIVGTGGYLGWKKIKGNLPPFLQGPEARAQAKEDRKAKGKETLANIKNSGLFKAGSNLTGIDEAFKDLKNGKLGSAALNYISLGNADKISGALKKVKLPKLNLKAAARKKKGPNGKMYPAKTADTLWKAHRANQTAAAKKAAAERKAKEAAIKNVAQKYGGAAAKLMRF